MFEGLGKRRFATDQPRSRLVLALLVLIALLVLSLVGRALHDVYRNRVTAVTVLQDYARLVADEYTRRAMGDVGYYGYFAYMNALRQQIVAGRGIHDDPVGNTDSGPTLARYRFLIDHARNARDWSQPPAQEMQEYLQRRALAISQQPAPESGLTIDHVQVAGEWRTVVFASLAEPDQVFGFEVEPDALSARFARLFEQTTLLPESLGKGAITNESIYLRVTTGGNAVLFDSRVDFDPYLLVSKVVDDAYSGIFEGYTIETAISPDAGYRLIIGGLPGSRLPGLIATIVATLVLFFAAIRQLNREHAFHRMRSEFVAEVSHELRTPLTQIRMFTETLLHERLESAKDRRRALEIISREAKRLAHLVDNVLRFSRRNGAGQSLNLVRARVAPVIERVVDEFRPMAAADEAMIEFDLDREAEAVFDDNALRQILLNLLDNAIKYGPARQRLVIALRRTPRAIQLSVSDEGPGVPQEARESIWNSYYRLERERDSAIAGTGIGLAVVRDLATRMHGKVQVIDGAKGGACFVVELPRTE